MKRVVLSVCLLLVLGAGGVSLLVALRARQMPAASSLPLQKPWNAGAAESYLEGREVWWQGWPQARLDHGTVCVSCHTVVPYALVQPVLRRDLGGKEMSAVEKSMLASVEKRVTDWATMVPFYSDAVDGPGKTAQSHATEAVLNAVILANYDTASGHLRPVTRAALNEAWSLQETTGTGTGGWAWQDFNLAPWESKESAYQGAAMLAIALGNAPDSYVNESGVLANVDRLQGYLRREYASQPLMSQLYVLWASAKMPKLMTAEDRSGLVDRVVSLQQPDGGWALNSLDDQSSRRRSLAEKLKELSHGVRSDGCATGLVMLALAESEPGQQTDTRMRGLAWLEGHQEKDGSWLAYSLNETRDPTSDIGKFMSDAATGYAVLALETARKHAANRQAGQIGLSQRASAAAVLPR